jgi:hypothetical protein
MEETKQPYEGKGHITKADLCAMYQISSDTLRKLLNIKYYDQLLEVGYNKQDKILTNLVFEKFKELWGEPI